MALRLPPKLKLAQLKTLTVACGLPSSGTKDVLAQRLESAVSDYRRRAEKTKPHSRDKFVKEELAEQQHILSIDLGIRNLALAFLTPSQPLHRTRYDYRTPIPVILNSWKLVEFGGRTDKKRIVFGEETDDNDVEDDVDETAKTIESVPEKDQWSPANMAGLTWNLVVDRIMTLNPLPTHILIERQRFRSGGAAAVQEWTLRVNTLEAMLHAVLRSYKETGRWKGQVYSIAPGRVGPFWLNGAELDDTKSISKDLESKKSAKARNKKAKIDLVGNWLHGDNVKPVGDAELTARSYLKRWTKKPRSKASAQDFAKLDDLADSLLQGMAWIKWESNIKLLATDGSEALTH